MKILPILLFAAIVFILFLITELVKKERLIKELQSRDKDYKPIKVSYTLTESDYNRHKPKKLPFVARAILAKELAIEIESYFPYMKKEIVNGHTRYTQSFRVKQD